MKNRAIPALAAALLATACTARLTSPAESAPPPAPQEVFTAATPADTTLLQSTHDADINGDWKTAAAGYRQLLDKNPTNKDLQVRLADVDRKLGETAKAEELYEAVLKKDANYIPAIEGNCLALIQQGDTDKASAQLLQIAQAGKGTWRTYNALGIIAGAKQSFAAAQPYFDTAQRLSPNNPSILNNIGLARALAHDYSGAEKALSQASVLAVTRPLVRQQIDLNAAMAYAAGGRLENAEALARQYFTGQELKNHTVFYAKLAHDEKMAKKYLDMALTQSRMPYPAIAAAPGSDAKPAALNNMAPAAGTPQPAPDAFSRWLGSLLDY